MVDDKLLSDYHDIETISSVGEPALTSKAKVASALESRSSNHDDDPVTESIAARCRQQKRTKKRSDMKYRQDRAKKRLVERQLATKSRVPAKPKTNTTSGSVCEDKSTKPTHAATSNTNLRHRRTCQESLRSPGQSEKLKSLDDLFQHSDCEFFSEATSPTGKFGERSFLYSSSSVRKLKRNNHHHYHPFRTTTIHSSELHIDLEDSDIEAADIATTGSIAGGVDATSSVFPLCMSPLHSAPRWREVHWQPDDVQLLEYFIL